MTEPLLSIVIPTHNRGQYARHAIRSILDLPGDEIQLVVHDTSTRSDLADFVAAEVRDDRLIYVHCPTPLSMTENHNAALSLATGTYVCLIGDDDTILPEALDAVRMANAHKIEALAPLVVANYAWPDFKSRIFGKGHAARIYFRRRFGGIRVRESQSALNLALSNAAQGTEGLPKLYHGFVRREVLLRIKDKLGVFLLGSSPDVAAAIGIAVVTRKFVEIDYPLTLPGASGQSNTGRSAVNTHKGNLADDPQTAAFVKQGWPDDIPRFFSVETVWAHAALQMIEKLSPEKRDRYNFIRLSALCWLRHPDYREATRQTIARLRQKQGISLLAFYARFAKELEGYLLREGSRLAFRCLAPTPAGWRRHIDNVQTIAEAQMATASDLSSNGISFTCFWDKYKGNDAERLLHPKDSSV
jgi:glycosyltransferase involved in cell wall biosynthesis